MRDSAAPEPSAEQPSSQQDAAPHDRLDGLGRTPSGPSFTPWQAGLAASPYRGTEHPRLESQPFPLPTPADFSPPVSRLPGLLTAAVVLLVTVVAVVATLSAVRNDARTSARPPAPAAAGSKTPPRPMFVEFSTAEGSGRLVVIGHSWRDHASKARKVEPSSTPSYLRVEVELLCDQGILDYNPYFFQAFDATGQRFDMAKSAAPKPALDTGTLTQAETVRGYIAFDIPHGEVTLLMSDAAAASVVAVRISD